MAQNLGQVLSRITEQRWIVTVSGQPGQPTLAETAAAVLEVQRAEVLQTPIIKEVMSIFPDATLQAIKPIENKGREE